MTQGLSGAYVGRVLIWHLLLLAILLISARFMRALEPRALILGGVFMALNFGLLSLGTRWMLSPTASRKQQRVGAVLLFLKLLLFLGLVSAVFFHLEVDGVSFVVGISSLLIASVIGTLSSVPSFRST